MSNAVIHLASWFFALLALCGLGYLVLSLFSEWRFLRQRAQIAAPKDAADADAFTPPVSILKPLRGTDRQMYESFRSHCLQDYPCYEIVFGVNQADDEAVAEVERLKQEFPRHDIHLLVCPEPTGTNRKVSNLVAMLEAARYGHIVINDSDILVEPDYLRRIVAPLRDEQVGLVTALYRAQAGAGLASRTEAVTIASDFAGGVLCAVTLDGGMTFGLGSTMAFPRRAAQAIGGLETLLDHLADDHELGKRIYQAGYKVVLSDVVVETFLPDYGFGDMFRHQLRWARTMRDLRRAGYAGVLMTFGLPWAVLAAILAGGAAWSLWLLAVVAAARFASAVVLCGPVLKDKSAMRDLWLVPVRDFVGLAVWFAAFGGNTIEWRGEQFHLKDGKLTRL
ncbi:MAG: bacteriohopanetetrol glucosamine biosynthesis glycosyltransferase HpnI [Acidobacteriota bacterium]|nr:bacteriohopanetetrol glucosamine biosynthesis glycosyltransferase HpnI [Acidobacteriota bacterium]